MKKSNNITMSKQLKKSNKAIVERVKTILLPHKYMPAQTSSFSEIVHKTYSPVVLFTKFLTIKNCRKCKTKMKKSFIKNTYENLKCKDGPNFMCKTTLS